MLIKAYRPIPVAKESKEIMESISKYHEKYMSMINNSKDYGIYPVR